MERRTVSGMCRICLSEPVDVKHIDLYVSGSEGLWFCSSCEMQMMTFVQALMEIREHCAPTSRERSAIGCTVCRRPVTRTRDFHLQVMGEPTRFCHKCEMQLVQFVRDMKSLTARARLSVRRPNNN